MISTREIAERLRDCGLQLHWRGEPPGPLTGLASDSRRVRAGDLFCAISGAERDGHEFVVEAEAAGASAALVERLVAGVRIPQLVVADSRIAVSHLASLFKADPGTELNMVGVTGTNGKTTTVWIARHVLGALGPAAGIGTLGVIDSDGRLEKGVLTTPGPVELMVTLRDMVDADVRSVAMEVSSHALDQHRVDALRFDAAVFTNVDREHLDYHPDMERYTAAKLRLADLLAADGACIVNADEEAWEGRIPDRVRQLPFGLSSAARVRADAPEYDLLGSRWTLKSPGGDATVELPLIGEFNVLNALGAAAAALHLGMTPSDVAERLASVPQVPGRMEVLRREPTLVLRDYAHTPDALSRVLRSLRELSTGKLFVVFGCGGDRDRGKRPLMGRAVAEGADLAFVTTDNPRSEDPADICGQIVADLDQGSYEIVLDRAEAIARALEVADGGDLVLLAGKGHERSQIIGDTVIPFDEAEVVSSVLEGVG
jgi:UDP-N-acetylmuramoyl-L-alanyl-D-glutamate--2,6-diaminopimelate ligase